MKVLLDSCLSGKICSSLQEAGHDVIWIGDWDEDPGDQEILLAAHRENRVLITLDKDFGELVLRHHLPHAGIVRLVNQSVKQQASMCLQILEQYSEDLQAGAIVTAESGWVKIRPME